MSKMLNTCSAEDGVEEERKIRRGCCAYCTVVVIRTAAHAYQSACDSDSRGIRRSPRSLVLSCGLLLFALTAETCTVTARHRSRGVKG